MKHQHSRVTPVDADDCSSSATVVNVNHACSSTPGTVTRHVAWLCCAQSQGTHEGYVRYPDCAECPNAPYLM
jgi:hypothetical protein